MNRLRRLLFPESFSLEEQTTDFRGLVAAYTRFSFALFSEISQQSYGNNPFISPLSVALALAMICDGARGETREAIAKALQLQETNPDNLQKLNAAFMAMLKKFGPGVSLSLAQSVVVRRGIPLEPNFTREVQKYYRAKVSALDFSDPAAAATVNAWVSNNTRGKITHVIDSFGSFDTLVLISAIYFKGIWHTPFDPIRTFSRDFTLLNGQTKSHPMMSTTNTFRYLRTEQFQAVGLPYKGRRLSMYIFLPHEESSLAAFQETLTAARWEEWMPYFSDTKVDLTLPRFKLEYTVALGPILETLGMGIAFDRGRANFEGITPAQETWLNAVTHKTFVEVNEEGTEAAAMTKGLIAVYGNGPEHMMVDRPFFCAIRDEHTGAILFVGSIVEPL